MKDYPKNIFFNADCTKDGEQKLRQPCPFIFWTLNDRQSFNFIATNKFKVYFFALKEIQFWCIKFIFALTWTVFELLTKTRYILSSSGPIMYRLYTKEPKLLWKYRVFDCSRLSKKNENTPKLIFFLAKKIVLIFL